MGLRADVIHELSALDASSLALRRFGLTVGGAFTLIAGFGVWRHWPPLVIFTLAALAAYLVISAAAAPGSLRVTHRFWMTFALTLGWCMSRLILAILFSLAVVPIALLGRLLNLPFMKIRRAVPQETYWIDHPARARRHHTDMF